MRSNASTLIITSTTDAHIELVKPGQGQDGGGPAVSGRYLRQRRTGRWPFVPKPSTDAPSRSLGMSGLSSVVRQRPPVASG